MIDAPDDLVAFDAVAPADRQVVGTVEPATTSWEPVSVRLDEVALAVARSAAVEEAGSTAAVGQLVDAVAEDPVAVTAWFLAHVPGYRGWHWSVTLAMLDAARPTVSEVVLLPGAHALVAPAWVPWEQRIRSGDLGVGDLLPTAPDDFRLVPGYVQSGDPAIEEVALEIGLGRVRVMSRDGAVEAAERWHDGSFGPADDMATHAPAHCLSCGFYLPLAGSLGALFGACGNEYSPADGRVVDAGYGCGAHSEALTGYQPHIEMGEVVVDELVLEVHSHPEPIGATDPAPDRELPVSEVVEAVNGARISDLDELADGAGVESEHSDE